jgi:hypothetical protein
LKEEESREGGRRRGAEVREGMEWRRRIMQLRRVR